ncbi:MAG: hypothetical protein RLZZ401_2405 [Pseudomonadota bacterium]|jgi:nucleoside-diphosphate-sugar epimerase
MKVLVTGASGFVGQGLLDDLQARGQFTLRAALRQPGIAWRPSGSRVDSVVVGELSTDTDWDPALAGIDTVVHLAARVHVMRDRLADPLAAFHAVNVQASVQLARSAARAGVRRLVYLSTAKVHGESTLAGESFSENSPTQPGDPYSISKLEAEHALRQTLDKTATELVVLRPPLVYGPGVGANFGTLIRAIRRGIPLPLAAIDNQRSLVGLGNLTDAIILCLTHPAAAGQTYLLSDQHDLSTPRLIRLLAAAMERPDRLWSLPPAVLYRAAAWLGRASVAQRLCDNLCLDARQISRELGWKPRYSVVESIQRSVEAKP